MTPDPADLAREPNADYERGLRDGRREAQEENTDLHLVAQGMKHYWHCDAPGACDATDESGDCSRHPHTPCVRCQRDVAEREGWRQAKEAAALLHESINNDCDQDRIRQAGPVCGCGAMGAVIEYRDAIRNFA